MTLYILTFLSHYEGNFGDLEGPHSSTIGVFSSLEEIEKAKLNDKNTVEEYHAQFGSAINDYEVDIVILDKPIN
tara:strand:+ start:3086 stop:3307 length:222 start_codon:yes stop_codon:yes gene_type:complete